jgi:hypothetical protein
MNDRSTKNAPVHDRTSVPGPKAESAFPSKYEAPGVVDLGRATGRILNSSSGNVKDYSNSWYCYA